MRKFALNALTKDQRVNRRRLLEISLNQNLSHIGSCLSVIDIIEAIYQIKKKNDKFALSNGHAGIALYAVLEKYKKIKDKKITSQLHIHPDRNPELDIQVSSGSLGLAFPIALGMALANKKQTVYCTISDGECAEGSVWETLRIMADNNITNLTTIVNANGWGAYSKIELKRLLKRIQAFGVKVVEVDGHNMKRIIKALKTKSKKPLVIFAYTRSDQFPFLVGQHAHYYTMNQDDYKKALQLLA